MWTLIKKESLENILTLRFVIGFVICNLMFGISTYVLVMNFNTELGVVQAAIEDADREFEDWNVYSEVRPTIYRTPSSLAAFGSDVDVKWGKSFKISHTRIPVFAEDDSASANLLGFFEGFSFTSIVQFFVALIAMLFAFDAICGEKEKGSLRLIMANGVGRARLLAAKFIGCLAALVPIIITGFIVSLLVFISFGNTDLSGGDWVRLAILILLILLYGAIFIAVGLLISSLTHRSAVSLVVCMIVLIVWVVILPSGVSFLSMGLGFEEELKTLERNIRELSDEYKVKERWLYMPISMSSFIFSMDSVLEGRLHFKALSEKAVDMLAAIVPQILSLNQEYAQKRFEIESGILERRLEKIGLNRTLQLISPSSTLANVVYALTITDTSAYLHFVDQARRYKQELENFIAGKGGRTSRRWFTDQPVDASYVDYLNEWDSLSFAERMNQLGNLYGTPEYERMRELISVDMNSPSRRLDLNDMPGFEPAQIPIQTSLASSLWEILFLVVYAALALAVALIRMMVYDVR